MKERPDVGVYVKDLSSYVMNNADDLDKTMTLGNKNRKYTACLLSAAKPNDKSCVVNLRCFFFPSRSLIFNSL